MGAADPRIEGIIVVNSIGLKVTALVVSSATNWSAGDIVALLLIVGDTVEDGKSDIPELDLWSSVLAPVLESNFEMIGASKVGTAEATEGSRSPAGTCGGRRVYCLDGATDDDWPAEVKRPPSIDFWIAGLLDMGSGFPLGS